MTKVFASSLLLLASYSASSAIIEYNDITDFNSALSGETLTLETFDTETTGDLVLGVEREFEGFAFSYLNSLGGNQRAGIYSAAEINANRGTAINASNSVGWGEYNNGNYQPGGDGPIVTFRFFAPITAFAFDFSDSDPTDSYSVQFDSETPFALDVPSNQTIFTSFFGFISDTAFNTITFSQTATGGITEFFSIDNIRTNGFKTQDDADNASDVSEPTALAMLLFGLSALLLRRRKALES